MHRKKKWKNLRMKGARNYFKTVWLLTVERNHFGLYDFQFQCFSLLFYLCRHFFMHLIRRSQRLIYYTHRQLSRVRVLCTFTNCYRQLCQKSRLKNRSFSLKTAYDFLKDRFLLKIPILMSFLPF